METQYRVLIVEDIPTDAELNEREIQEVLSPCVFRRVETEEAFITALDEFKPDIIISDYSMPYFDGMTALKLTLEKNPITPFILVTGSINEDTAVGCMKAGATNYIIKQHRKRLGQAVLHALEEKKIRLERLAAREALKESEEKYRNVVERANDGITIIQDDIVKYVNARLAEMWGGKVEEVIGTAFSNYVNSEELPIVADMYRRRMAGENITPVYETVLRRRDNSKVNVEINAGMIMFQGKPANLVIVRDITERKHAEEALRASEAEIHDNYFIQSAINIMLSESLKNIPFQELLQKSLNIVLAIPWIAFEAVGSLSLVEDDADVLVMKAQSNLSEPLKRLCIRVPFGKCMCGKAAQSQEIQFADHIDERHEICYEGIQPHGHYSVPILFSGRTLGVLNIYLKEGHIREKKEEDFLHTIADTLAGIIMRKKAEEKIEYLAYFDALTGLPNRNLFLDRLKQGIDRSEYDSKIVAVVIANIDRFKSINDTYGIHVGDLILKEVAGRLASVIRKGDTVARFGNDEFGIALLDIANPDDIIPVIDKIIKYISHPLQVEDKEIVLTYSAGISICPHDSKDPQTLLKFAGLALGKAKGEGRQSRNFYTEELNVKASEFQIIEKNLYIAVQKNEFFLHYQPYWEINTQRMVGMEALIRWQSRDMGLVSPQKFIPALEDTGMIIGVGEWILREAMGQIKEWQNKGYSVVPVSVNLSLIQFRQKNIADTVKKIMGEYGFYPSLLTLEITESAFMQDIESTSLVIRQLSAIGVSISIDDFGTGYSSLAYLKRFPVDNLKIDITFIREMVQDPDSASIVMAIINMAHTLNLKTIAEGIETEEQWKFLHLLRCDMGQGFYFSKPLAAQEVEKLFKKQ